MGLYRKIVKFNERENLIENGDKIVVGFSGGPDSVFMVTMLLKLKETLNFEMVLVHINHMIRGKDADHDEEFSRKFSLDNGLKFYSKRIEVEKMAKQEGTTTEEAGREARYNLFNEIMERENCNKIALAHNKDDQIETFLFRLIRGTGLTGLTGILAKRDIYIRPICEIYKRDIVNFLDGENIEYCIDKTNFENEYTRNSIRLDLIPMIEEKYNPKFKDRLYSLIEEIRETNMVIDGRIRKFSESKILEISELMELPRHIRGRVLADFMYNYGVKVSRKKIKSIENILDTGGSLELDLGNDLVLKKQYDILKIDRNNEKKELEEKTLTIPGEVVFGKYLIKAEVSDDFVRDRKVFCSNLSAGEKVVVRSRKPKDKIELSGMNGSKKVKDIFINEKIEKDRRDEIPIITYNDEIIWIAGIRSSKKYNRIKDNNFVKFTVRRIK